MLAHVDGDAELDAELRGYFRRYRFSVVANLVADDGMVCAGLADLDTGVIELSRTLLSASSSRALHVYLHELAHIIANDGHSLNFAVLAARLQERFHCRDVSRWRLQYDTHETTADEWRWSEYLHLRSGGSVPALTDPEDWIKHRRQCREVREAELERQRAVWPALLALVVAVVVVSGIALWPWVSGLISNDIATFFAGLLLVAWAIWSALLSDKC